MRTATGPDDVPWLSEEQLRQWMWCMGMITALPAALDAQLKRDSGVNMFEYHVLAVLAVSPSQAMAMSELATLSRGSASRLSHAVGRLERHGWVERRSCTSAGHRTEAHLTESGLAALVAAAPGHVREVRRRVIDVLDADQFHALASVARAIVMATDPNLAQEVERQGAHDDGTHPST